eukprot:scaffold12711_cov120-Isochrysis_galbana.AAC.1
MRDFRMVALALIFTVAMELDMANHQAGQGQGSKGEPLAFLCAQLLPPGMPRLFLWPWWTHNCVRRQDQQALARQPQPTHRLSGAQTTPTEPITPGLTIPTLAVGATRSWEQPHTCTPCQGACLPFTGTCPGPGPGLAGHLGSDCSKDSSGVAAPPINTSAFAVQYGRLLRGGQLLLNIQKTGRMSVPVPTICTLIYMYPYASCYPAKHLPQQPISSRPSRTHHLASFKREPPYYPRIPLQERIIPK